MPVADLPISIRARASPGRSIKKVATISSTQDRKKHQSASYLLMASVYRPALPLGKKSSFVRRSAIYIDSFSMSTTIFIFQKISRRLGRLIFPISNRANIKRQLVPTKYAYPRRLRLCRRSCPSYYATRSDGPCNAYGQSPASRPDCPTSE